MLKLLKNFRQVCQDEIKLLQQTFDDMIIEEPEGLHPRIHGSEHTKIWNENFQPKVTELYDKITLINKVLKPQTVSDLIILQDEHNQDYTTQQYWQCECVLCDKSDLRLHHKVIEVCPGCNHRHDEMPDARLCDVLDKQLPIDLKAKVN